MEPRHRRALFILAGAYTLLLIAIELVTSPALARNFFTDIHGPVPFYAINTTISVFLQWATALTFAACLVVHGAPRSVQSDQQVWFYRSQIVMFAVLGAGDRFQLHEWTAGLLGIGDYHVLLALATAEVMLILALGGPAVVRPPARSHLLTGAACFAVMIFIGTQLPQSMRLRPAAADLAKTWGVLFLFLFAWEMFLGEVRDLRAAKQPADGDEEEDNAEDEEEPLARAG